MPQLRLERGAPAGNPEKTSHGLDGAEFPGASKSKLKPGPGRSAADVARHQRARIHRAMVDIVAERGYGCVTVRELAGLAGVSTRTFYQHYSGKEECFLRVHELAVGRLLARVQGSRAGAPDEGIRLAIDAILEEWRLDPKSMHLVFVDVFAGDQVARERALQARRAFATCIERSLNRAGEGVRLPSWLGVAIASGITAVVRSRLLSEHPSVQLGEELTRWALSYSDPAVEQLEDLERPRGPTRLEDPDTLPPLSLSLCESGEGYLGEMANSDAALLLSAATKLVVAHGPEEVTPRQISARAGVSHRSFDLNFLNAEDCIVAGIALQASRAMTCAKIESRAGSTPAGGVYRAVAALCEQVAQDATFASLCFGEAGGPWRIRSEEQLVADAAGLLGGLRNSNQASGVTVEASAAALLGVIQRDVGPGQNFEPSRVVPPLAFLLLAPALGPSVAVEVIQRAGRDEA